MATIYVIINEFFPEGAIVPASEVISPARWKYEDALEDLADIARAAGVEVDADSSISLPAPDHLESDEYYIIPLEVEDRG